MFIIRVFFSQLEFEFAKIKVSYCSEWKNVTSSFSTRDFSWDKSSVFPDFNDYSLEVSLVICSLYSNKQHDFLCKVFLTSLQYVSIY